MRIEDLANPELVTLALTLLGGELDYVDHEDVAVKCEELAEERFAWRKYRHRTDLVKVSAALRDAKKPRCGSLVVGNNAKGFMLTRWGAEWVRSLHLVESRAAEALVECVRLADARQRAEIDRLRSEHATRLFEEGSQNDISLQDACAFARVNDYFPPHSRIRRVTIVERCVLADDQLSQVWSFLRQTFPEVFS